MVLASGSPRRRQILEKFGIDHKVIVSSADEETDKEDPCELVKELSFRMASDVKEKAGENVLILAADTVVALDGKILGKPGDEKEAENMLKALSGRSHDVYSGVAVIFPDGDIINFAEKTAVHVRKLTDEQIADYIATGEPMDKAGAYGIQGLFGIYVEKTDGDYLNVVGLPASEIYHRCLERGYDLRRQG